MIDNTVPVDNRRRRPNRPSAARTEAIRDSAIVLGAILLALLLVTLVARSLVRPLRTLRDSALRVAHDDLAREIDRVRSGKEPGPVEPIPVHTTEEIGQVAHAVDELHEQAIFLAGEQSRLQLQVGDMFETLSRRSRTPGRPTALAHRPAGAQRGGPGAAGEPVPARPPGRADAPQRRQPVGARRREGAARAGRRRYPSRRSSTPPPPRSRTTPASSPRRCPTARSSDRSRATSCTCLPNFSTTRCATRRRSRRCGCRPCTQATAGWSSRSATSGSA